MNAFEKALMVLTLVGVVGISGCSTPPKPFEYESNREIKPGPGLFSGDDGYFTIYQQRPPSEDKSPQDSKIEEQTSSEENIK